MYGDANPSPRYFSSFIDFLPNPTMIKVPEFRYHFFEEVEPFIIDGLYSLTPLAG